MRDGQDYVLWANQMAAIEWMAGQTEDAVARWQSLPLSDVTRFNLGMAGYALGRTDGTIDALSEAGSSLPEASGWAHLARMMAALMK